MTTALLALCGIPLLIILVGWVIGHFVVRPRFGDDAELKVEFLAFAAMIIYIYVVAHSR